MRCGLGNCGVSCLLGLLSFVDCRVWVLHWCFESLLGLFDLWVWFRYWLLGLVFVCDFGLLVCGLICEFLRGWRGGVLLAFDFRIRCLCCVVIWVYLCVSVSVLFGGGGFLLFVFCFELVVSFVLWIWYLGFC